MVEKKCELCHNAVSGKAFECVIFCKPGYDDKNGTEDDIAAYRCYSCDDKETDKMLWT